MRLFKIFLYALGGVAVLALAGLLGVPRPRPDGAGRDAAAPRRRGLPRQRLRAPDADGRPLSGRDLRLMDDVARSRFVHFTYSEIAALHAYLKTLGAAAAGTNGP